MVTHFIVNILLEHNNHDLLCAKITDGAFPTSEISVCQFPTSSWDDFRKPCTTDTLVDTALVSLVSVEHLYDLYVIFMRIKHFVDNNFGRSLCDSLRHVNPWKILMNPPKADIFWQIKSSFF